MAARTMREELEPDLTARPFGVTIPLLAEGVNFELKPGVIHWLPKFEGKLTDDPIMHLKAFHEICMASKPANVTEEQFKMRAFGFSLKDDARSWYYRMLAGSINTWAKLHRAFLDTYFPAKRANELKRGIINFEQGNDEPLYDYVERFKKLIASCPYHGFSETGLVMQLYNGMLKSEKKLIDIGCGGSITNLTSTNAMNLITDCANGSRNFGETYPCENVSATSSGSSDTVLAKIAELKSLFKSMVQQG